MFFFSLKTVSESIFVYLESFVHSLLDSESSHLTKHNKLKSSINTMDVVCTGNADNKSLVINVTKAKVIC